MLAAVVSASDGLNAGGARGVAFSPERDRGSATATERSRFGCLPPASVAATKLNSDEVHRHGAPSIRAEEMIANRRERSLYCEVPRGALAGPPSAE